MLMRDSFLIRSGMRGEGIVLTKMSRRRFVRLIRPERAGIGMRLI
jgi:hypothetical protein